MFSVFLHLIVKIILSFIVLLYEEKKNAKKRLLSHDQNKDDDGQHLGVIGSIGPPGLVGLKPQLEVPLIQPKNEPEEHESKWTKLVQHALHLYVDMLFIC